VSNVAGAAASPAQHSPSVQGGAPSNAASATGTLATPVAGVSMNSRQWASLLSRFRAGDGNDHEQKNPRSQTEDNNTSPPTSAAELIGMITAAAADANLASPRPPPTPVHAPNAMGAASAPITRPNTATARPRSRAHPRDTIDPDTGMDAEKTAMQNELCRLRALIAMQAHAAAAAANQNTAGAAITHVPPNSQSSTNEAAHSAAQSSSSSLPQLSHSHSLPPAGSLSPNTSSMMAAPFHPHDGLNQSSFDHRSTFRSMSMLIRGGGNSNNNVSSSSTHHPHHPASAMPSEATNMSMNMSMVPPHPLMQRSRSAHEPVQHVPSEPRHMEQQSHATTSTAVAPELAEEIDVEIEQASHSKLPIDAEVRETDTSVTTSSANTAAVDGEGSIDVDHDVNHTTESQPPAASPSSTSSIATPTHSSLPPPSRSSATRQLSSRKSPRPCTNPLCLERARRDRAELMRVIHEQAAMEKSHHVKAAKGVEARYKRELAAKEQRIAQLEKYQKILLTNPNKLAQQYEELTQLVAKLSAQVETLGGVPVTLATLQQLGEAPNPNATPSSTSLEGDGATSNSNVNTENGASAPSSLPDKSEAWSSSSNLSVAIYPSSAINTSNGGEMSAGLSSIDGDASPAPFFGSNAPMARGITGKGSRPRSNSIGYGRGQSGRATQGATANTQTSTSTESTIPSRSVSVASHTTGSLPVVGWAEPKSATSAGLAGPPSPAPLLHSTSQSRSAQPAASLLPPRSRANSIKAHGDALYSTSQGSVPVSVTASPSSTGTRSIRQHSRTKPTSATDRDRERDRDRASNTPTISSSLSASLSVTGTSVDSAPVPRRLAAVASLQSLKPLPLLSTSTSSLSSTATFDAPLSPLSPLIGVLPVNDPSSNSNTTATHTPGSHLHPVSNASRLRSWSDKHMHTCASAAPTQPAHSNSSSSSSTEHSPHPRDTNASNITAQKRARDAHKSNEVDATDNGAGAGDSKQDAKDGRRSNNRS